MKSYLTSIIYNSTLSILILLALSIGGCKSKQGKPNILWITFEDTSPQFLSSYGYPLETTPTFDKFANEGVRFTNVYATGAVCSSSRNTLITGVSTEVLGTGNHRSKYKIPHHIKGFPFYLKQAGYYTSNNKKTDYNIKNEKAFIGEAWDESSKTAGWWKRSNHQPFFSVFNFNDCHQSRTMTKPWGFYEEEILDHLSPDQIVSSKQVVLPPFYRDSEEVRRHFSRVPNSLKKADLDWAKVLDRLEKDGLKENTIIFMFADHGEGMPRGKTHSIGFGHRVPFLVWFPKKYRHLSPWGTQTVTEELISFEDLAPTILSLAGLKAPSHMKGRALLGDQRKHAPKFVFGSRNRLDDSPGLERTVFDGKFVYSRNFYPRYPVMRYQKYSYVSDIVRTINFDHKNGLLDEIQSELVVKPRPVEYLYDLENDPWETKNLAYDPMYQKDVERLRQQMVSRVVSTKDIHFIPEGMMVKWTADSTAYQLRDNKKLIDIEKVIEVANKVGKVTHIDELTPYFMSDDEVVRYWAAVGINLLGKNALGDITELQTYLHDPNIYVQIEIANMLYKTNGDLRAKEILINTMLGRDYYAAHHAMQQVIYEDKMAKDFLPTIELISKRYNEDRAPGFEYSLQNTSEMFLYIHKGDPLFYKKDLKYMQSSLASFSGK